MGCMNASTRISPTVAGALRRQHGSPHRQRRSRILIGRAVVDHRELAESSASNVRMCRDRGSSTTNASSHASRKLTIIRRRRLCADVSLLGTPTPTPIRPADAGQGATDGTSSRRQPLSSVHGGESALSRDEVDELCRRLAQCCENAAHCMELSRTRDTVEDRLELLALARTWLELATDLQRDSASDVMRKVLFTDFMLR